MTKTISKQTHFFSKSKQGNKKVQTVGFAKDNIENIKYVIKYKDLSVSNQPRLYNTQMENI